MNPYKNLPERAFWAPAVGRRDKMEINELWDPKFNIKRRHQVATFGSCFAQHIGRALRKRKYHWMQTEPAPGGLSEENAKLFNYEIFTCRTGNIYTVSLLNQWTRWALGHTEVPSEIFEKDGRFFDPFRPTVEPDAFISEQEMRRSQDATIEAFGIAIKEADFFVFTLGLTESWFHAKDGYEYPMCPGTAAGTFDADLHQFKNQDYPFIRETLVNTLKMMREANASLKFILTVSPVPLTATMSGNHVLTATVESKSILRAVAGDLAKSFAFVDYFPSFEIISSTPFEGDFYEQNKRSVASHGVAHVMDNFFECLGTKFGNLELSKPATSNDVAEDTDNDDDVVCDEEFLETFAPNQAAS